MGGNNYCCIPGCRRLRHSKTGGTVTLFSLPKNQEDSERWRKAIEKIDKKGKIGYNYKVCELHFTEDNILRYYETLLPDDTVWRMERRKITIKNGAVPTIFPDLQNMSPKLCTNNSQSTNQPNFQNSPRKRKSSETFNGTTINPKKVKTHSKILPKSKANKFNNDPKTAVTIHNENFEPARKVLNEMTAPFTYNTLVENLELVSRPNLLWGISIHDAFVMCAKWNEDTTLMKRVVIDCNLRIQVFLQNKAIDFDNAKINNINHLTYILQEVDKYGVCYNAYKPGKTGCDGYVLPRVDGNRCRYCLLFGNYEINRNKSFYWLSKGRNFSKLQTLYDRINSLTNNNARLKAQINKIMKIKAVWKLSNQTSQNPITS